MIAYLLVILGLGSIVSAAISAWAYESGQYRLATFTEVAAAILGFFCGVLLPFLLLMVSP